MYCLALVRDRAIGVYYNSFVVFCVNIALAKCVKDSLTSGVISQTLEMEKLWL